MTHDSQPQDRSHAVGASSGVASFGGASQGATVVTGTTVAAQRAQRREHRTALLKYLQTARAAGQSRDATITAAMTSAPAGRIVPSSASTGEACAGTALFGIADRGTGISGSTRPNVNVIANTEVAHSPDHGPPASPATRPRDTRVGARVAAVANTPGEPQPTPGWIDMTRLGPGMLLRLRHLGFASPLDLADAQPEQLREALGQISRLIDVEAWIANARRARASCRNTPTSDPG